MSDSSADLPPLTIGVDLGSRDSHVCMLDASGKIIRRRCIATSDTGFLRFFCGLEPARVIVEVGSFSRWAKGFLEGLGHEVLVADARTVRLIAASYKKNDKRDAEILARFGRSDPELLNPIRHRSDQRQADLALLKVRDVFVATRTRVINHVRGIVKMFGKRLPSLRAESFHKKVAGLLPKELLPACEPLLVTLAHVHAQIAALDKQLEALAEERYPEAGVLRQVHGVGPVTGLAYVLTLEDPRRFRNNREAAAYLGLVPRQRASGDDNPQLRITKAGNAYLRMLLINCAHYILGPLNTQDSDLRRWGQAYYKRGGGNAKKRAVVAVARKLAVLLLSLWRTGEVYDPLRNARRRGEEVAA